MTRSGTQPSCHPEQSEGSTGTCLDPSVALRMTVGWCDQDDGRGIGNDGVRGIRDDYNFVILSLSTSPNPST
jgi:hypothetical protein